VRRLNQSLAALPGVGITVTGLIDEYTQTDLNEWSPLVPRIFPTKGFASLGYSPPLQKHVLQDNYDLVHQHGIWQFISLAAAQWQKKSGRPHLISPRGMLDAWALKNSAWKKRIAGWLFENEHLRRATCLHALCESEAQSMRAYGLKNPIAIIPNGIDLPSLVESSELRVEGSIFDRFDQGRKVLLHLGRIHPKKGLVNLLRAWKQTLNSQPSTLNSWVLAIAGWDQGGHEAELKRLCDEMGIAWGDVRTGGTTGQQDNGTTGQRSVVSGQWSVIFLGPQFGENKSACYCDCDAFILPSYSEGLPMVVLEAWAYGKPVLMTQECNLREGFVANAAIRIEPSAESIARGLRELFQTPSAERQALGDNGRALVAEKFTWPKIAADMKSVYEWVMGNGPKPGCVVVS
jgi:poly(glycerol-phosphate) alpha-glucosyltransferase